MNTANFDRLKILQACNEYIQYRKNHVEKEKEKIINKIMDTERKFLWFNLKPYTREQVLFNLENNDLCDYYFEWLFLNEEYTWEKENKNILSVKELCSLTKDYTVTLDSVTIRTLSRFL